MNSYSVLSKQSVSEGEYNIVPIRFEDRHAIMKWRNEQIYHLRQAELLNRQKQNQYYPSFFDFIEKIFK